MVFFIYNIAARVSWEYPISFLHSLILAPKLKRDAEKTQPITDYLFMRPRWIRFRRASASSCFNQSPYHEALILLSLLHVISCLMITFTDSICPLYLPVQSSGLALYHTHLFKYKDPQKKGYNRKAGSKYHQRSCQIAVPSHLLCHWEG